MRCAAAAKATVGTMPPRFPPRLQGLLACSPALRCLRSPALPLQGLRCCSSSAQRINNVLLAKGPDASSKRLLKLLRSWQRHRLTVSRTEELLLACQAIAPSDPFAFQTAVSVLSAYEEASYETRPRVSLYLQALTVAREAKRAQGALDLLDRFMQAGGWPTTELVNAAVAACIEAGAPLYALRLISSLEALHVNPDDDTLALTKRVLSALEDPAISDTLNTTFLFQTLSSTLSSTKASHEPSLEVWRQLVWLLCWTSYPGCLASLREIMGAVMRRKAAGAAHFAQWLKLVEERTGHDLQALEHRRRAAVAAEAAQPGHSDSVEEEIRVTMQRRFHQASILLRYAKFHGIVSRDTLSLEGCMAYIAACVRTNRPHAVRHVLPVLSRHSREGAVHTIEKSLAPLFHTSTVASLVVALNVLPIKALVLSRRHWVYDLVAIALKKWRSTRTATCPTCFPAAAAVFSDAASDSAAAAAVGRDKALLWEYGITAQPATKAWIPPTASRCPMDYVYRRSAADKAPAAAASASSEASLEEALAVEREWVLALSPSALHEWVRHSGGVAPEVSDALVAAAAGAPCGNECWSLWRAMRQHGAIEPAEARVPMAAAATAPDARHAVKELPDLWRLPPAQEAPRALRHTAALFRAFVVGGFMGRAWELFLILFPNYRGPLPSQEQAEVVAEALVSELRFPAFPKRRPLDEYAAAGSSAAALE